jgi:hypothetical protein
MSVTITVLDPLTGQLKSAAQQRRMRPKEPAADLLPRAFEGTRDATWYEVNQRRRALLHKSAKTGLAPPETQELQEPRALADQRLESLDADGMTEVERMEWDAKAALQAAEER